MRTAQNWKRAMTNDLVVLDASLVVKAILPNPQLEKCQSLISRLGEARFISPALWLYEVSSALVKSVHFGQLTADEAQAAIHQASALGVELIPPDETQCLLAMRWAQKLQRASVYDCFYLAIAEALQADFYTGDRRLLNALQAANLPWLHGLDAGE